MSQYVGVSNARPLPVAPILPNIDKIDKNSKENITLTLYRGGGKMVLSLHFIINFLYKNYMENFNAKEYRDNLAKDLKEIRKTDPEKAQETLEEAQQTEEYQEAKRAHHENRENKEKLGELEYYPIFRGNALYNKMFPDIEPLFQAGEEPNAKVILNEILEHSDSKVTLDNTCYNAVFGYKKLTEDDFPENTNFKNSDNGEVDLRGTLNDILKNKGIEISQLDSVVANSLQRGNEFKRLFDDVDAGEVVSLIKDQVPEVNRVVLAISNIGDHVGDVTSKYSIEDMYNNIPVDQKEEIINKAKNFLESDFLKEKMIKLDALLEKTRNVNYYRSDEFKDNSKEYAIREGKTIEGYIDDAIKEEKIKLLFPTIILSEKIKSELDIEPEFVADDLNDVSPIDEKTAIIFDRHNKLDKQGINPRQKVLLPLSSGIQHAQSLGVLKNSDGDFAMKLRKNFEKKEEKE